MFGDVNTMSDLQLEREWEAYTGWSFESSEEKEFDYDEEFTLERGENYLEERGMKDEFESWVGPYTEDEKEYLLKDFISNDVKDFEKFLKED